MHKQLPNSVRGSRGMTLVELLLVMAILSIVMLAVMSLYVPAHQSAVAQSQVSDVQSNLRLALKTMTRDLLTAGFLMPYDPIAFPDASPNYTDETLTNPGMRNNQDFIIRTRAVGSDFARVRDVPSVVSGNLQIPVADGDMISQFPNGSRVRLFEPMTGNELKKGVGSSADRAYTVVSSGSNTITITMGSLVAADVPKETVMIGIRDENQPALQTIRYRIRNDSLERIVNGAVQVLARDIDTDPANSYFEYDPSSGTINRVDITLTGKTKALKNDAISGEKSRAIKTSVKLRNIN